MRVRERLTVALTVLAALVSLSACGSGSAPTVSGDTLNVVRTESFDGWVLDSAAAYATVQTHGAVIEGLLRFAPDGKSVKAGLADEWTYDRKAMTWTFRLRDGARFSNGKRVTAADVAFSLKIWKRGPNFGPLYDRVKRVRTPDDRTVVFEMKTPDSVFDSLIASSGSGVMPADFGGVGEDEYYRNPIGAGAYKVDEWSRGGKIVLSPNRFFYDPERPRFKQIVADVVTDENERRILFEAGDADIVEYVSPPTASQFHEDTLEVLQPSQISHLSMNTQRPPFDDRKVRRAVAYAIDYNSIVNGPLEGFASEPSGILAPNLGGWAPTSEGYYNTDRKQARRQLAGSSHPGGFKADLIYDSGNESDGQQAQIVQADLAKLGIEVNLTGLETAAFLDRAFSLDADMVLWSYGAVSPDISDPLGWIGGTSWLFTGFDTKPLTRAYDEYIEASSDARRDELITEIQDWAAREVPAVALAETQVIHAVADGIEGFDPAPWGLYFYDTLSSADAP